ncbi:MAG: (2Fe-2S)-binding protein [Rhodovibrionaceae bacterium]
MSGATTTFALEVTVNGRPRRLEVDPGETLLSLLRERLELTGAKRGCNQGVCGACTVLLDGKPVRACLTVAASCGGAEVETAEGLLEGNRLSALQQALVAKGAVQCGYCTPGMAVALSALLRETPLPSREEVREAISGHLCRCSGYAKIVDAAVSVAEMEQA